VELSVDHFLKVVFVSSSYLNMRWEHQQNVGAWSKVVLSAPGPPRGVVVSVVHLVHSDPL